MTTSEKRLLADCLVVIEEVGCEFEFCDGPTLRPKPMITCNRCAVLARLRKKLALGGSGIDPAPRVEAAR